MFSFYYLHPRVSLTLFSICLSSTCLLSPFLLHDPHRLFSSNLLPPPESPPSLFFTSSPSPLADHLTSLCLFTHNPLFPHLRFPLWLEDKYHFGGPPQVAAFSFPGWNGFSAYLHCQWSYRTSPAYSTDSYISKMRVKRLTHLYRMAFSCSKTCILSFEFVVRFILSTVGRYSLTNGYMRSSQRFLCMLHTCLCKDLQVTSCLYFEGTSRFFHLVGSLFGLKSAISLLLLLEMNAFESEACIKADR